MSDDRRRQTASRFVSMPRDLPCKFCPKCFGTALFGHFLWLSTSQLNEQEYPYGHFSLPEKNRF